MDPQRILVAHEDPLARRYLGGLLQHLSAHDLWLEAESFDSLVEQLRAREDVLVVLIDLELPGLSGDAGLRWLCSQFPSVRLALLFTTLGSGEAAKLQDLPIAALIAKSTPKDALVRILEKITIPSSANQMHPATHGLGEEEIVARSFQASLLTTRQKDVMRLLSEGFSNREIAQRLHLAEGTVKCHVNASFRILGVHNRVGAARVFREFLWSDGGHSNRMAFDA